MLDEENKQFAYEFLADRQSYHSQKENSAYATFLVEAGLFGALWTTSALGDFMKAIPSSSLVLPLLVLFIWSLFHVLLRWQLRNRRIAALQVATLLRALTDHLANRPGPEPEAAAAGSALGAFFDHFIPLPKSSNLGDIKLQQFPEWYRLRYLAVQEKGTGASFGEIFPTYGSIIMVVATLAYVFSK